MYCCPNDSIKAARATSLATNPFCTSEFNFSPTHTSSFTSSHQQQSTPQTLSATQPHHNMESTVGNAIPAVGSRISLISSGDIRYEGILYSIDMVESKIALQQGTRPTPSKHKAPHLTWMIFLERGFLASSCLPAFSCFQAPSSKPLSALLPLSHRNFVFEEVLHCSTCCLTVHLDVFSLGFGG